MAFLARLGFWQLDRLAQRRAANELLREQLAADPLSLNDPQLDPDRLDALPDRAVTVSGTFDYSEQVLLKLQNFQGRTGGRLIAPLRIAGREEAVLVDRGWLPEEELAPGRWSAYDETGVITITGRVRPSETSLRAEPPAGPQQEWYRVNVEAIERQLPYELLPVYVRQSPAPESIDSLPYREEARFDLSEGPHLSYAIQWFLFSLMLGGGYLYFVKRQEQAN